MSAPPVNLKKLLPDNDWVFGLRWVSNPMRLPKVAGVYILFLQLTQATVIKVGALGEYNFPKGYYFYVGSAKGAGGLTSRVGRHWLDNKKKKKHWHIDYLREAMVLNGCWVLLDANYSECDLVATLQQSNSLRLVKGFGSSDCSCVGHVLYLKSE